MKKLIIPALVVVLALAGWRLLGWGGDEPRAYRFVEVDRGDVISVVSSTGTLQATTTVEVGTQVSGQIAEIFVDFNDHVTENQLVARIDPTLLQQEVRAAEANLDRNQAELDQARRELDRMQRLYDGAVVTESEYTTAQYHYAVAQASYKSAQINLERAQRNLNYSEIRAPISGVVLDRKVDVGQTVAASFSAPLLFLIAEDLSQMEILATVDESDIGQIRTGQRVRFTVQAYPDETFEGRVAQVRLQSTSQENVVNYVVVIAVENPDGHLLPGMTATVDFIVQEALDVLRVSNAALRFRPTSEMVSALRPERGEPARPGGSADERSAGGETAGDSLRTPGRRASANRARDGDAAAGAARPALTGGARGAAASSRSMLWRVDADGTLRVTPVVTGITDGQYTEIRGPGIDAGMQIIAAVTSGTSTPTVNPFQGQQDRGFRGPPPGM